MVNPSQVAIKGLAVSPEVAGAFVSLLARPVVFAPRADAAAAGEEDARQFLAGLVGAALADRAPAREQARPLTLFLSLAGVEEGAVAPVRGVDRLVLGGGAHVWGGLASALECAAETGFALAGGLWRDGGLRGCVLCFERVSDEQSDDGRVYSLVSKAAARPAGATRYEGPTGSVADAFEAVVAASVCVHLNVLGRPLGTHAPESQPTPWVQPDALTRVAYVEPQDGVTGGFEFRQSARGATAVCRRPPGGEVFLLGAARAEELIDEIGRLLERLGGTPDESFRSLARGYEGGARGLHRLGVVADDGRDLAAKLEGARARLADLKRAHLRMRTGLYYGSGPLPGKVAVLFPGQGSQYPSMLRELCLCVPGARRWFDALDAAYMRAGAPRPSSLLYRPDAGGGGLFGLEAGAQLGLAASYILYSVIAAMGARADFFLGHSNGEHAALTAAGVIRFRSIEEACELMCQLSLESARLPPPAIPEGMMAVGGLRADAVRELAGRYPSELFFSVDNCPTQMVLAGRLTRLRAVTSELKSLGAVCNLLPFARAHHTPLFADWSKMLYRHYSGLQIGRGSTPVYSCLTAGPYPEDAGRVRETLMNQWAATVRFREAVMALYERGARVFIEAGPNDKLSAFVDDTLRGLPHRTLSASSGGRGDFKQLAHLAAELYAVGVPVDLGVLHGRPLRDILLAPAPEGRPAVPPAVGRAEPAVAGREAGVGDRRADVSEMLRREHRAVLQLSRSSQARVTARVAASLDGSRAAGESGGGRVAASDGAAAAAPPPAAPEWPLLGEVLYRDGVRLRAERRFSLGRDPFLRDHCLGRGGRGPGEPLPVLAFTLASEIVAEAVCCLTGGVVASLSRLRAHSWLALRPDGLKVEVEAEALGGEVRVQVFAVTGDVRTLCFEGVGRRDAREAGRPAPAPPAAAPPPLRWNAESFYRDYAFHGPAFQGIERVRRVGAGGVEAELVVTSLPGLSRSRLQLDPALFDCAGQLAALWVLERDGETLGAFPFAAAELQFYGPPPRPGARLVCRGVVERDRFDTLSSTFEFVDRGGSLRGRLAGFEQRLIRLPEPLWKVLFGRRPLDDTLPGLLAEVGQPGGGEFPPADWKILTAHSGVWARALAHMVLSPPELHRWYSIAGNPSEAVRWLVEKISERVAPRTP